MRIKAKMVIPKGCDIIDTQRYRDINRPAFLDSIRREAFDNNVKIGDIKEKAEVLVLGFKERWDSEPRDCYVNEYYADVLEV